MFCDLTQLCEEKYGNLKSSEVMLIYHTVKYLQQTKDLKLQYASLESKSLKLYVLVDSGYNTKVDLMVQPNMIIFLVDDTSHCYVLH